MKKVSVITLHRVTNFGSLLQTYATETIIKRMGYEVEIIDFVPEGLSFKRAIWPKNSVFTKKVLKFLPLFICNLYQFRMADMFLKRYISLSPQKYDNYTELAKADIKSNIFLSGSDQVWNIQNNNPQQDLGAYYLSFINELPKIAYAGSFGREEFNNEEKSIVKDWLKKYNAISVREDSGLRILKDMELTGVHVVDPTFLITKDEWSTFCSQNSICAPKEGYVFVYNLNRNKLLEEIALKVAKKYNLGIVNFADTFEFIPGAYNKLFNTPLDFLAYLSNAEYVITDSFHGTSFSINMEKQFITVAAPKYNTRIESVLRMMHCEERLVKTVDAAMELCENPIDYSVITPIVNYNREQSKQFLENALHECE